MSERYPIKLENPRQTMQGPITHARALHGVEGWELWGEVPGGGEIHLNTKYYRKSPEMPEEWKIKEIKISDIVKIKKEQGEECQVESIDCGMIHLIDKGGNELGPFAPSELELLESYDNYKYMKQVLHDIKSKPNYRPDFSKYDQEFDVCEVFI